ncbi:MAG: FKBP-type peptidyl-prolyl cis-trans isomerase [Methanoregulaceae archaeon]|jgi:FKBP-type peptidyl-prolyl cis-trans isomerase|nr:FKBP-type peptidyl-prolyl cis-trans isomerase [Methanoregulaceae archaeon]
MFKDALVSLGIGLSVWSNVPALEPGWQELRVGSGNGVVVGDRVTIHFLATTPEGNELANSRKRGLPYTFVVTAEPYDLLSRAAIGMRPGGIRLASFPPERAFGQTGLVPIVPPNATLQLTVNLIQVAGR